MSNIARTVLFTAALAAVSGTAVAQTAADPATTTDTVVVEERDDRDFPWGLLGLLGLAGLLGRKRDVVVRTDDRTVNDSLRR